MHEPTYGDYEIADVPGIDGLIDALHEISMANSHEKRVSLVSDLLFHGHEGSTGYLKFGNNKVHKNTGIFNMNAATDCPNADTTESDQSDTGVCQVPWESCYAHNSEHIFDGALPKRRRQEYLWDNIDAVTFADALLDIKDRKTGPFEYLRVSESGDFRHRGDIIKMDTVAELISGEIDVYTYSASHKLDWSHAEHFTVNQSNALAEYGDRLFSAVENSDAIPDDAIFCPFEAGTKHGVTGDDRTKCGECTACIEPGSEQSRDVYISIH